MADEPGPLERATILGKAEQRMNAELLRQLIEESCKSPWTTIA